MFRQRMSKTSSFRNVVLEAMFFVCVHERLLTSIDMADPTTTQAGKRVRIIVPSLNRVGTDSSLLSNGVKERAASPLRVPDQYSEDFHVIAQRFHNDGDTHLKRYGRHGDINPGNILWYGDDLNTKERLGGTLKIADFGQAEVNSLLSRTKRRSVANTLTYRPPECDLQPSVIRQSYDIWCLGCVYLEFVTWLLGGKKLYCRFNYLRMTPDVFQYNQDSDTFFQVERNSKTQNLEFMIKPAVTKVRTTRSLHQELVI